jgi:hypothetical protein
LEEENRTNYHNYEIQKYIDEMVRKGEIHEKVADYLLIPSPRTPQLYLLPKIHKKTLPTPGRPVVSANDSPTERISELVDHFLNPLIPQTKSYLKDTTHFLQEINEVGDLP